MLNRIASLLSLRGRCSRRVYLWFIAASGVSLLALLLIGILVGLPLGPTFIVLIIAIIAPSFFLWVRRLHDVGLSGWLALLFFVPLFGAVFQGAVAFKRGQVGPNQYADDPLKPQNARPSRPVREWTLALLCGLATAMAPYSFRIFAFQPYTIPSAAMEPNLHQGDYVVVSKWSYGFSRHSFPFSPPIFQGRVAFAPPKRGDIIVFKLPRDGHTDYIKRLIGLPGDRVQMRGGRLYINGLALKEDVQGEVTVGDRGLPERARLVTETGPEGLHYGTLVHLQDRMADDTDVYIVPAHCYFMVGDNRDNSVDSRFGPGLAPDDPRLGGCGWNVRLDALLASVPGVGFVPEQNLVGRTVLAMATTGRPRVRLLAGG